LQQKDKLLVTRFPGASKEENKRGSAKEQNTTLPHSQAGSSFPHQVLHHLMPQFQAQL